MSHTISRSSTLVSSLAVAAAVTCATTAQLSAQVYGADTSVTQSDRLSNGGYTNGPDGVFNGGESFFGSSAMLDGNEPDLNGSGPWHRGLARASALLSGATVNPLAPLLRAEARLSGLFSDTEFNGNVPVSGAAFTQAGAIETYQYTGASSTTLTLTYNLHADYFNQGGQPGLTGIFLTVGVLGNVSFYSTSLDTQIFEGGALPLGNSGVQARGQILIQSTTGGFTTQTMVLAFDVMPGQVFSVVAQLQANAVGGMSYADAYSTATGTFDRPDLITSLSAPAPSVSGLLALGALVTLRRRR